MTDNNLLNVFPIGTDELDSEILLRLDIKSIDKACLTNKRINRLCDAAFWRSKFERDYVDLGHGIDYKKLYHVIHNMDYKEILTYSVDYGYLNLVSLMLDKYVYSNTNLDDIFYFAVMYGYLDIIKLLIKYDPLIHKRPNSALAVAIKCGRVQVFKYLIENGANITDLGNSILVIAAEAGEPEIMNYLFTNYKYDSNELNDALQAAVEAGNADVAKLLIMRGADVYSGNERSIIEMAAMSGNLELVTYLLENYRFAASDINSAFASSIYVYYDDIHSEPDVIVDSYDITKLLFDRGADVDAVNMAGTPAIVLAAQVGNLDTVKLLVNNGADIHRNDDEALRYAVKYNHLSVVAYLLDHGANIHANNDEVLTLAFKLAKSKNLAILLLDHGANKNADDGNLIINQIKRGNMEAVKVLLEYDAIVDESKLNKIRINDDNKKVVAYVKDKLASMKK